MSGWSVGIDTGGTFTDLAAINGGTGEVYITKVPSTPGMPANGILTALEKFFEQTKARPESLTLLSHGTTVATNAVLEGKGARAGLLINKGFRAVYPAKAGLRPRGADLIDPAYRKPDALVPLSNTFEIGGRISANGTVVEALDRQAVVEAARQLGENGCSSVAICFLFSFLNDAHEREAAEILQKELPNLRISLSCEVLPVIREYPRMSTVALDAYVGPIVNAYFVELSRRVGERGFDTDHLFIMQSNGGLMRIDVAARYPNETLLSGPAAGVAFAAALATETKTDRIITFDVGGTSADMSLIVDGRAATVNAGTVAGQTIGTSMVEIRTIGVGGGAIARKGDDGLLKVGPHSAGAVPGPACYDRGGTEATVTDANVVLGYLDAERFLGGALNGKRQLADQAISTLADQFGIASLEAALGIRRVMNAQMASALRLHITDKGFDPRRFSLLAFGGSGPLHAAEVAAELRLAQIIVPPHPGVSCATGLLFSDVRHIYMVSMPTTFGKASIKQINEQFEKLTERAIAEARIEGFEPGELTLLKQFDVRYLHQGYQLTVDASAQLGQAELEQVRRDFDTIHEQTFGIAAPAEEAEIVTLKLVSVAAMPKMKLREQLPDTGSGPPETLARRKVYFSNSAGYVDTPVYARASFRPGVTLDGPAIIEQLDSTTVVGPDQRVSVDRLGNLIIDL